MSSERVTLVVGASENPARYSNKAINALVASGEKVRAYGLRKGEVAGISFETEWPAPETIDTVTLYVGPSRQDEKFINAILGLKPRRVIFNPGTENPIFQEQLREVGVFCEVACTLVLLSLNQYA